MRTSRSRYRSLVLKANGSFSSQSAAKSENLVEPPNAVRPCFAFSSNNVACRLSSFSTVDGRMEGFGRHVMDFVTWCPVPVSST